jgi:SAM-dependent methyltransferase
MPTPREPQPSLARTIEEWWKQGVAREGLPATLRRFLTEVWGFLRDSTPERRRRRYGDIEYDWDYRVDTTSANVPWRDRLLGVFHSPYQPTEPALFRDMLDDLKINYSEFMFLDLGSGKGRTLLLASDYPFRRILGVELLPALHRIAQANLRQYQGNSQKCFAIESLCADARHVVFPPEPAVIYLFNPFPESILEQVIANLERSLREHPRKVVVLYHHPLLEPVVLKTGVLRKIGGTHQYSVYAPTA